MATEPAPVEVSEEAALGGSPAGRAANAAMRAFSKAARAFTLYDPQNEAVRRFLQEYRDSVFGFLKTHGALDLEVRQFELARGGEIVHAEKDREKSLAYRLFRDGIRRLVVKPDASWEELLKLLEVLSVRFIGVRQQEEDVVTLLTRAAFRSIAFTAASGVVAEKEEEAAAPAARGPRRTYPANFDGPTPPLLQPRIFGCFPIPPLILEEFEAEEGPQALPGNAVRMVRELMDDANQEELKTLVPAVEEVRDFLLAGLEVKHLRDLARVVAGQHGKAATVLGPSLKPLASPQTLQKLLATVPQGEEAPDALVELLDLLSNYGADLFDPLIDRLATSPKDRALETLASRAARGKKDRLLARMQTADPALAGVLLGLLKAQAPAALPEAVKPLLSSEDAATQLVGLKLLEGAWGDASEAQVLALLDSGQPEVRAAAAEMLAKRGSKKAFAAIGNSIAAREATLEASEAEALGAALATLAPAEAKQLFEGWMRPAQTGLLSRLVKGKPKRMLMWTAAAGLVQIPGEETLAALREMAAQAPPDEELKKHCLKCIALWRRRGAQANG